MLEFLVYETVAIAPWRIIGHIHNTEILMGKLT